MTAATLTLADFLLARIAEDEAVAREATPGPWYADDTYSTVTGHPFKSAREAYDRHAVDVDCWVVPESMASGVGDHNLSHIARHDPARVLAECEAKRRRRAEVLVEPASREGAGAAVRADPSGAGHHRRRRPPRPRRCVRRPPRLPRRVAAMSDPQPEFFRYDFEPERQPFEEGVTAGWLVLRTAETGPARILKIVALADEESGVIVPDGEWQDVTVVDDRQP